VLAAFTGRAAAEPLSAPAAPPAPVWLIAPKEPEPPRRPLTYFEEHSARVTHDLLLFQHSYTLDTMRARDTLELYGPTPGTPTSTALGIGAFAGVVVSSAHTPRALRFAFDGKLHVGPAIFDGGGMGAGFGGRM